MTSSELMNSSRKNANNYNGNFKPVDWKLPEIFHMYAKPSVDPDMVSLYEKVLRSCPNVKNVSITENYFRSGGLFTRAKCQKTINFDYVGHKEDKDNFIRGLTKLFS